MDSRLRLDEASVREIFRTLLTNNVDPVILSRPDGSVLHANPAACEVLGRTQEEIVRLGRRGLVVDTPELAELLREREARARTRGEVVFVRPDGTTFPAEFSSTLIPLSSGGPVSLLIFRDVSSRRKLEGDLRESEALFRTIFQTLPDAVTITDLETGTFVAASEGAATVTGWNPAEMIGRTAESLGLWHEGDRPGFVERVRRDGAVRDFPTRLGRKDGTVIDVLISARPVTAGGRRLLLTVTRDVTEVHTLQAKVALSSRLAAMGTLVAGVAHEINNPLGIMLSSSGFAREAIERVTWALRSAGTPDGRLLEELIEAGEALADCRAGGERISRIVREMVSLSRPEPVRTRVKLLEVLREALRWLPGSVSRFDRIQVVDDGAPDVLAAPVQLQQVVVNLVSNAVKSIPMGRKGTVVVRVGRGSSGTACLEVSDDGSGMTPAVLARVFDPFFTTRPVGEGMGLGLPICHSVVTAHGGTITATSEAGKGSTFRVELPAVMEPAGTG